LTMEPTKAGGRASRSGLDGDRDEAGRLAGEAKIKDPAWAAGSLRE